MTFKYRQYIKKTYVVMYAYKNVSNVNVFLFPNCRCVSFHCFWKCFRDALVRLVSIHLSKAWSPLYVCI